MISLKNACEKAVEFIKAEQPNVIKWIGETTTYYLFGISADEEVFYSPISVDKFNGNVKCFSIQKHEYEFKTMKKITVPSEYAKEGRK